MINLVSYPVTTNSGKINNMFAGFDDVNIEFKREDLNVFSVGSGADNKILVTLSGDYTGDLFIGEWLYLYATGTTYVYDNSFKIISINYSSPDTEILVDGDFIESSTIGYINYKQDYFAEAKLVNVGNNDIKQYSELITDDGNNKGEILINITPPVDYLQSEILATSGLVPNSVNRFKVMYREVWRENQTEAFILIDQEPIYILYNAELNDIEKINNKLEEPIIWHGYPFIFSVFHSLENNVGYRIEATFNETDINKNNITTDNYLTRFSAESFGQLQVNFNDNTKEIEENTRYIKFNLNVILLSDYDGTEYSSEYAI